MGLWVPLARECGIMGTTCKRVWNYGYQCKKVWNYGYHLQESVKLWVPLARECGIMGMIIKSRKRRIIGTNLKKLHDTQIHECVVMK